MGSRNFNLNDLSEQKLTITEVQAKDAWTLDEAVKLIRQMQPLAFECGYHLNLGGGVLNKGFSNKDLDILAMFGSFESELKTNQLVEIFKNYGFSVTYVAKEFPGIVVFKMKELHGHRNLDLIVVNDHRDHEIAF